ncbi:MAG: hypothetical protein V1908_01120 [Candidatus Peregrinibacteria bacterium]
MPSFEQKVGEPQPVNKDYTEIIYSELLIDRKYVDSTGVPAKIVYYCPQCKKLITPKRVGQKFRFSCAECKTDAAFGTETSIASYYRLPGFKKLENNTKKES